MGDKGGKGGMLGGPGEAITALARQGLGAGDIAAQLGISESVVKLALSNTAAEEEITPEEKAELKDIIFAFARQQVGDQRPQDALKAAMYLVDLSQAKPKPADNRVAIYNSIAIQANKDVESALGIKLS